MHFQLNHTQKNLENQEYQVKCRGKDEMPSLEHLETAEPPDLVLRLIYL